MLTCAYATLYRHVSTHCRELQDVDMCLRYIVETLQEDHYGDNLAVTAACSGSLGYLI